MGTERTAQQRLPVRRLAHALAGRPGSDRCLREDDDHDARALLREQLADFGGSFFSDAPTLHTPAGSTGPWDAQYVRANVEPWDLADLALPGADRVRLEANGCGLDNMALAGSWVRTPVNTTSVEAAVCSGLAAARALGVHCRPILSEDLFRTPPTHVHLPGRQEHDDARSPDEPRHSVATHEALGTHPGAPPRGRGVSEPRLQAPVVARPRRRRGARRVSPGRAVGGTA